MTTIENVPTTARPLRRSPGAVAPLVREAWYVLAARSEFGRELRQRWVLGEPVCFFEAEDGALVALDDRCAHRRFPLSRSVREGDTIRCRYHGFTYGTDGRCLAVPGGTPGDIKVRSYPTVERGPWVWIWTGADADAADPDLIPWPKEIEGGDGVTGYTENPCNYSMVHENLLDLTHLEFLHGIGGHDFTVTEPRLLSADELPAGFAHLSVGYGKDLDTVLDHFAVSAGDDPTTPVFRTGRMMSVTPAINYAVERFEPTDPGATARLRTVVIAHCVTPADDSSTHQFWMYWQDVPFVVDRDERAAMVERVFSEDVEALTWIQEYVDHDERAGVVEHSVPADVPGLRLRRLLHRLAAAERA
ncbi:Rieske 2Fe-2S domain-containing protein [Pseudonocardia sp. WMMC193]|uniref:Rieske 2Fe-2S domain-containing protein n=1 Tax=Pseudonocardia sp. WMMC193 TaxID=2911965 RepID=UPI001F407644|nr:Rieske 2Fe-2S domain-containing protein [Pseudonocardia sp. WMMC193]MCF7553674.1 Rieske 2Fe-2S domain-containing protein [Pseudonocardia sp. WMMC193]